jgi:hypothetical protein
MKEIPLTRGLVALVDDADFEYLSQFKWYADRKGYALRSAPHPDGSGRNKSIQMHRDLLGLKHDDPVLVDHEDLNKANNQRYNLRIANKSQNQHNQGIRKNNTSGFKGVTWNKSFGRWHARIRVNTTRKHLGYFDTPEEAHAAYQKAAIDLHGEFANAG